MFSLPLKCISKIPQVKRWRVHTSTGLQPLSQAAEIFSFWTRLFPLHCCWLILQLLKGHLEVSKLPIHLSPFNSQQADLQHKGSPCSSSELADSASGWLLQEWIMTLPLCWFIWLFMLVWHHQRKRPLYVHAFVQISSSVACCFNGEMGRKG